MLTVVPPLRILGDVHVDVASMSVGTYNFEHYFQMVVDRASRRFWVQLLRLKGECIQALIWWHAWARANKPNHPVVQFTVDGAYSTKVLIAHCKTWGITLNVSSAHTQSAWLSERGIGLLREMMMPSLSTSGCDLHNWGDNVIHNTFLLNKLGTSALPNGVTRNDAFNLEEISDEAAKLLASRPVPSREEDVWGCEAMVKVAGGKFQGTKCEQQAVPHIYFGKSDAFNGKLVQNLRTGRRFDTKNAKLNSSVFPCKDPSYRALTTKMRAVAEEASLQTLGVTLRLLLSA